MQKADIPAQDSIIPVSPSHAVRSETVSPNRKENQTENTHRLGSLISFNVLEITKLWHRQIQATQDTEFTEVYWEEYAKRVPPSQL